MNFMGLRSFVVFAAYKTPKEFATNRYSGLKPPMSLVPMSLIPTKSQRHPSAVGYLAAWSCVGSGSHDDSSLVGIIPFRAFLVSLWMAVRGASVLYGMVYWCACVYPLGVHARHGCIARAPRTTCYLDAYSI
jgi:hypothetical protein